MSVATIDAVISRLREDRLLKGPLLVNWHAGEPLVLPADFFLERMERFRVLAEDGIEVEHSLQTNATLVNDEHCQLFKRFCVKVGVSVDGPAFIHDAKRQTRNGKGTHVQVQEGMRKLAEHGISFNAICVLSDLSVRHPDELYEFFAQSGVRAVAFNVEEIEGANKQSSIESAGFCERFRSFLERFWELVEANGGRLKVREFDDAEGRILDTHGKRNSQTEPFVNLSVASNGDWSTFCPELLGTSFEGYPDFNFGNVHTGGFRAALETEKFQRTYSAIQAGVQACREQCDYFQVCGGGNPSNKISENGSFVSTRTLNCTYRIMAVCDFVMEKIERRVLERQSQLS